jgi:hypothetical protein
LAVDTLERAREDPSHFLDLHVSGDWGDLSSQQCDANQRAIAHEGDSSRQDRVLSIYRTCENSAICLITAPDRSVTTILLPEEFSIADALLPSRQELAGERN